MVDISKLPGVVHPWPIKPVNTVFKKKINDNKKNKERKKEAQNSNGNEAENDDGDIHIDEYV